MGALLLTTALKERLWLACFPHFPFRPPLPPHSEDSEILSEFIKSQRLSFTVAALPEEDTMPHPLGTAAQVCGNRKTVVVGVCTHYSPHCTH